MATMENALTIGLILPDVLGTYGDDGNALVLRQRARMRGLEASIVPILLGDAVPDDLSVYTVGGGEDVAQILAAEHLIADGGIYGAAAAGRPILAICAGLQVFGGSFRASGRMVDGLGLLDATTASLEHRMIGEITSKPASGRAGGSGFAAGEPVAGGASGAQAGNGAAGAAQGGAGAAHGSAGAAQGGNGAAGAAHGSAGSDGKSAGQRIVSQLTEPLTGFANHMGATILGPQAEPLGIVTRGTGNTDAHGLSQAGDASGDQVTFEGAVQGSLVATYMHGPALARNPQLADAILAEAVGTTIDQLPPLEGRFAAQLDAEVAALRKERLH